MEKTIEIDGVRLHYRMAGSGPQPVIVMHGWGCEASTVALLEEAATAEGTTVYNLDMPGFGSSSEPESVWGVGDYADMLAAFVRLNHIDRPVLIGHSFGGRVAIVYAAKHPVAKVILVDSAGIKPRRSLKYYFKVYSFKLAKRLAPLFLGRRRADMLIERMRGRSGSSDYAAASSRMRAIMSKVVNEDLRHLMPSIGAPTLLIWGENDTATPLADAKIMEKLIPDAGLVSYQGCGHYSFLERPAQTRAVVRSFLQLDK